MTEGSGRPTLEQVARHAGVGRGTVSRVVNGSAQVSPGTRAAVERAVRELGYVPNRAARALVTRRTDAVALVVHESQERLFSEPFFARVVRGISSELAGSDRQLVLVIGAPHGSDRVAEYLTGRHVDGVLLLSLHGPDPMPARLRAAGVPVVVGGRPLEGSGSAWVDVDNAGGAQQAAEHLLATGRRRIAVLAGPQDTAAGLWRWRGTEAALERAGRPLPDGLVEVVDFTQDQGRRGMRTLLERCPDVDGVLAASDLIAAGALQELVAQGRSVPGDVGVVGFDDSVVSRSTTPALTTVHQPVERLGREMTRLLLSMVDGRAAGAAPPAAGLVLPTRLVVRAST